MKKILSMFGVALLMAGCTEDFKDWAGLQTNPAEEAKTVSVSVGAVGSTIDLASAEETVQLFVPNVQVSDEAVTAYEVVATNDDASGECSFVTDAAGYVDADVLQEVVVALYNANPNVERNVKLTITSYTMVNGQSIKYVSNTDVKVKPIGPVIEAAYYLTGSINGWDNNDKTYMLTNDGSNPYDNPTFKLRIPATEDGSNIEFKMTPESGLGGDWSGCLAASETEGKFNYNNNGGNLVIVADPDALFYDLTFDMLEQTWSAVPVGFNEFIYEIGNESGWSEAHPLYGNGLGQYEAIIYLDGEFKFKPNKDNWDGDWEKVSGDATSGTLTTDGGPNIDGVAAGFYLVQVDLKEMSYKVTAVTSISIIGTVRGNWDTDIDMTYNENFKCWEARETLSAGDYKFRMNHNWEINWGGSEDNFEHGGENLKLAADGAYIIRFFNNGEAPAHCTVKADSGYPDFFYEIGNESGWSTSHALGANGEGGKYQGYYYLDGEYKFKPNADNWDNDLEYVSGDNMSGILTSDGGPNCPDPGAGFYQIDLDAAGMTFSLTKVDVISIIGDFNGWGGDVDMTYNKDAGCWEATAEVNANGFKFRMNHDWTISWGGANGDGKLYNNLTQNNGANIIVDEAGTYKFQLYISYEGNNKVVMTKQ